MNQPIDNSSAEQNLENSQVHGAIIGKQGDKNVQVQGEGNILTFNQTEILQVSAETITSRKLITTSPYKGLKSFESRDKDLFFGRDNFIPTLVNELEQTNLILLLGASGSGKSSVVLAGLIPWLEKKHGTGFTNLRFTPDTDPFESFYISLGSKYSQAEAKIAREVKAETMVKVVNNLKKPDEFWLIFVDQFEELFTTSDENKRREFINGLMKLSQAKLPNVNNNLKIMGTMRADFFERLGDFPQLVEATQKHRPMIVEMQSNELRLAIEQPAAYHGVVLETGLVDKIIADIQGQAGYLPLLQYTLNLVWEDEVKTGSINDRTLDISTYQKLGGVRGALKQHVDSIYKNFSASQKQATQRIFLKLVGIGENAESGIEWKPVRRRAMLSEFGDDERDVLLRLVNENLLVSDADLSINSSKKALKSGKSNSTVEIAHEILLTCWDQLDNWIKKNRQGIAVRNRLYEDIKRWQDKKPEDELWTGSKLEQVLELRKDDNFIQVLGGFNAEANQFIDTSLGLRDKQLKRTRIFAGIGFTLAALASVASMFAFFQQQEAQKKSIISMTQTVESRLFDNNQIDAIVEAIKAKKEFKKIWMGKDDVSLQVFGSLGQAVHHNQYGFRERLRLQGKDVIFSPKGKLLAIRDDKTVRLWDVASGKLLQTLKGHEAGVLSVVFSPDGKQLATASDDNTARLWDVASGKLLQTLKGHEEMVVRSVVFSPDGKQLATASDDNTARLWDVASGKLLQTLKGHEGVVVSVVFSPDGKQLATASNDIVRLWDVASGKLLQTLKGHEAVVLSVVFSPDGKQLATASDDNTARLWDVASGKLLQTLKGHEGVVVSVVFSPDGKQLATASYDKTARLWDVASGKLLQTLKGHEGKVLRVVFRPDGKQLATASDDKTARLWDVASGKLLQTLKGHEEMVLSVVFSPDGKQLATASDDKTARLWDVASGKLLQTLKGHEEMVLSVVFRPDGKQLATASEDKTARLWDVASGKLLQTLKGHEEMVLSVVFSPDGKQLATASDDKTARLWDVASGKLLQTLKGHEGKVLSVVFSPDGKQLATASYDNIVRLWDVASGKLLQTLKGHEAGVLSVVFSPDGKQLATASYDKTARLWDVASGKLLQTLKGHEEMVVRSVVFSPDGKQLATASSDKTARLWDVASGKLLQTLKGHEAGVLSVVFSPDGKQLATASYDKTARLWDVASGKLLQTLKGHEEMVLSVVFSPDGKQLATASYDKTARLWDVASGKLLQTLKGHEEMVLSVVFSPDGKQLATASEDKTVRLWRVGDMEDMLAISCDWVRAYLETKPQGDEDRHLCDGVKSSQN